MACCGCHEILIQRCITVFFLSIFVDLSSTASESSPFLCSKVDSRRFWSVVVLNARISQKRRSHGRIGESNRIIILSLPTELRERPVLIISSDSYIHVYLDWFSLLSFHCALKSAFGLRRRFLHSLTITSATLCDPVQNTTPEGILSQCWCSLTLTHTQPQWVFRKVGVPQDLDCTRVHSRSLLSWSKNVWTWKLRHADDKSITQRS